MSTPPATDPTAIPSWTVGDVTVHRVDEVALPPATGAWLLPDATADLVTGQDWLHPHFADDSGILHLDSHTFAFTLDGLRVLVDTGIGNGKQRANPAWHNLHTDYLQRLTAAGYPPDEVDLVILTHLHADHVGWNTVWDGGSWIPAFPEARYLALEDELDWAREGHGRDPGFLYGSYADSVLPLIERGRLDAVADGFRIGDRIEVRAVRGHTPGSSAVIVRGSRETAVLSGDLIHHPHQFAHPLTCSRFCVDRAASARARHGLLDWTARHGAILMPAHFGWGRVEAADGRFRFRPIPRREQE